MHNDFTVLIQDDNGNTVVSVSLDDLTMPMTGVIRGHGIANALMAHPSVRFLPGHGYRRKPKDDDQLDLFPDLDMSDAEKATAFIRSLKSVLS